MIATNKIIISGFVFVLKLFFYSSSLLFIISALSKSIWFSATFDEYKSWQLFSRLPVFYLLNFIIVVEISIGLLLLVNIYPFFIRLAALVFLVSVTAMYRLEIELAHSDAIACMCFGKLQFAENLFKNFESVLTRNFIMATSIVVSPWIINKIKRSIFVRSNKTGSNEDAKKLPA